jgi:hypothetical protein
MDIKIYSHSEKKELVRKMEKITSKSNYKQIYKIIKSSGVKITTNSNGVFFNMNELKNETLKAIEDFIDSVINKTNVNIDMKYYNNVIMNTTTQSEGNSNDVIEYNNDSTV